MNTEMTVVYVGWFILMIMLATWMLLCRRDQKQIDDQINHQYKKLAEQNAKIDRWMSRSDGWIERLTSLDNSVAANRAFWSVYLADDWSSYAVYITDAVAQGLSNHPKRREISFAPVYTLETLKEIAGLPTDVRKIDVPLTAALKELGWTKGQERLSGKRKKVWSPPATLTETLKSNAHGS